MAAAGGRVVTAAMAAAVAMLGAAVLGVAMLGVAVLGVAVLGVSAGFASADTPDGSANSRAGVAREDHHRSSTPSQRQNTRTVREPRTHAPRPLRASASHAADRKDSPSAGSIADVDPVTALLGNSTPRASLRQTGQSELGVVTGTVDIDDPDSVPVGIAVTRAPSHGAVTLSAGAYAYTPDPLLAHTGYVDSFDVTVTDADSGFHLHGLAGLLNLLTFGLLGAAGHTATTTARVTVSPFNNPPTAGLRLDPPDPLAATVTGAVLGNDVNGDILTYSGSTATAHGSVVVWETGEFRYTADTALPVRDTFSVTVDDGYGGVIAVPVTVSVTTGSPTGGLSTFCGCTLMPADTVFHADVTGLPVLPKSQTWTTLLAGTLHAGWGGTPWMGSVPGMPVNVVPAGHSTETVIFNRGYATSGPSIDDSPYAIPDRPLVEGMPDVPAWDRHLLVFQEGTCISQELYNVANGVELPAAGMQDALGNAVYAALYGSAWIAEAGGHVDMSSPLYPAIGWANASRLPYLPLILRPDDLTRGRIDHMLGIAIAKDRGTGYTWPARAGDGTGTNPDGVPMGTVLRLRADFPVEQYAHATQTVLRALQQHGAVVFDSFAAGRDGAGLLAMSNGWSGTDHLTAQRELDTIPLSAFEAVDVLSVAADPAAGWAIV